MTKGEWVEYEKDKIAIVCIQPHDKIAVRATAEEKKSFNISNKRMKKIRLGAKEMNVKTFC